MAVGTFINQIKINQTIKLDWRGISAPGVADDLWSI